MFLLDYVSFSYKFMSVLDFGCWSFYQLYLWEISFPSLGVSFFILNSFWLIELPILM